MPSGQPTSWATARKEEVALRKLGMRVRRNLDQLVRAAHMICNAKTAAKKGRLDVAEALLLAAKALAETVARREYGGSDRSRDGHSQARHP